MDRARTLAMMFIVCALGISGRVHAQTTATPDGWVVLGIDEYRALRERASPSPPRPEAPPVDATLTRVDYELRIDGDGVAGRATLTIDTLRDGWTRVEIPSGLMARDARADGQPVPLLPGDPAALLVARAGRAVVTLEISLPLASSAGSESIVLPASHASITRATIALPRTGIDLKVTGGFIAERTQIAALAALTDSASAEALVDGKTTRLPIAPRTGWAALRLEHQTGASLIGATATVLDREFGGSLLAQLLPKTAVVLGGDARLRTGDGTYDAVLYSGLSSVSGTPGAITAVETS